MTRSSRLHPFQPIQSRSLMQQQKHHPLIRHIRTASHRSSKKDRVLIYGDGQHQTGSLIGLDGNDAVVKLDGTNDFRIVNIDNLAKLSQHSNKLFYYEYPQLT